MPSRVFCLLFCLLACGDPAVAEPPPALEREPGFVRFAVVGDFGEGNQASYAVAAMVREWQPDFVVTTGDNNYPDGAAETLERNVAKPWAEFLGGAERRFFPTLGNHDWEPEGARPYLDFFDLPGNERYYSVQRAGVRIFALDSDHHEPDGVTPDSVQGRWLRDALRRSTACFNVVVFHHPPYSSGAHGSSEHMRWPFRAWGADAVFSGHDHTYERLVVDDLPYFVNGLGGGERYPFYEPLPGSKVRYNQQFGAMRVEANSQRLQVMFWTVTRHLIDQYEIEKDCDAKPMAPPDAIP